MYCRAFTLLELLITLAILGILLMLSYPSYQQYVLKSYRAEAVTTLLQLAAKQEQLLLERGRYSAQLSDLGFHQNQSESGRYSIEIEQQDTMEFQITLRAQGPQLRDAQCLRFNLNHLGQRNLGLTEPLSCWD